MSLRLVLFAFVFALLPVRAFAAPGNAWHIPDNPEPGIASMRAPLYPRGPGAIEIWSGNQFQGGGNPGNQLQTGSAVVYRVWGSGDAWSEAPLLYQSTSGNNVYYSATLPANAFAPGDHVEYYLRIPYSDHDTTYVYGSDGGSAVSIDVADAQQDPFRVAVPGPLPPRGRPELHDLGGVQVGWYANGEIAVVGDDVDLVLGALQVQIDDEWYLLGAIADATPIDDGFRLSHTVGAQTAEARLVAAADRVIAYRVTGWGGLDVTATRLSAVSPDDEHFYGFGEKFNALDQAGRTTHVVTSDPPGDKGDLSYKSAPWFASTRGYGFRLDTTAESTFDLRDGAGDRWMATTQHRTLAFEVYWGPQLPDVLARFTARTGRPPMPPPWAFGTWMSSDHWRTGGEVRYVATRMVEEGIPASVFVFDSPWEVSYNDFTWNEAQFAAGGTYDGRSWDGFASSQEMLEFLRGKGFKAVLWLTPFVNTVSNDEGVPGQNIGMSPTYAEAAANGYFVRDAPGGAPLLVDWWKGTGSPIDFTDAGARAWFQAQLQALVDDGGGVIGGFKIDDGEGTFVPLNAAYADGRRGDEMRNGYTIGYHEAAYAVLGADGILFSRSGYVGAQAYPGCWSGDNEPNFGVENGLPSVIVAGQSAAMSGYAIWGHDVGGYQDVNLSSTPENLFMRWAQFGAFTPIMQMHRQVALEMQYPWSFGPDGLANYREYARLHTELFPYVYSYARVAQDTGLPIIRPLVLHWQDDPNVWPVQHTYLFGEAFLVAPMVENEQTERTVYLPEGTWLDFWSHERIEGGDYHDWVNEDQTRFPLFVREGAIVPKLAEVPQTLHDAAYVGDGDVATIGDAWAWLVVPAPEPTAFTAYDDTRVDVTPGAEGELTIAIDGPARPVRVEVLTPEPMYVSVDDVLLERVEDLASVETGWTVVDDMVIAKFDHDGASVLRLGDEPPSGEGTGEGTGSSSGGDGGSETAWPQGSVTAGETEGGTDGESAGSGASEGCGCRGATPRTPALLLLLLVAAPPSHRRSRRRPSPGT